jgi:hypothetical protein
VTILGTFKWLKTIDSEKIDWTLGYMINQTNYLDPEHRPKRLITQAEFIGLMVCFLILLVASIIIIVTVIGVHKRRQQSRNNISRSFYRELE